MSLRDLEPEAHCYLCIIGRKGECAEFNALNPQYTYGYDRKGCLWGSKHQGHMILLDKNGAEVPEWKPKIKEASP